MTQTKLTPRQEMEIIHKIALRAHGMGVMANRELLFIEMDLTYCNESIPLDLQKLLDFPDFDFIHDVVGIAKHINHDTLKMEHCFLPRSAKPSKQQSTYVPRKVRVDKMLADMAAKS